MKRLQLNMEEIVFHDDGTIEDNVNDHKEFLKQIIMMLIGKGATTEQIASLLQPYLLYVKDNNLL